MSDETPSDASEPQGPPADSPSPPADASAGGDALPPADAPAEAEGAVGTVVEGGEVPAAPDKDLALPPEGWEPYSSKLGPRCNACGDLRASPAGCPACRPELAAFKEDMLERVQIRDQGYAPGEFFRGASYLFRGTGFLLRNPRLWSYSVVPLLINMVVALLGLWFAIYLSQNLHELATNAMADWEGAWGALATVLGVMLRFLEFFAALVIPLLLAWLLTAFPLGIVYKILFTPFMEALGGATDRVLLTGGKERIEYQTSHLTIVWAVVDALVLGLIQGITILFLLPLLMIPILGSFVWMVLPPSIFASMDFSDIHLVRRGYTAGEKLRLWKAHKWRFFGYGASFFFLLSIPLLNALAIPVATVGGALLYLELDRK